MKAKTQAFGKIKSSRANARKSEPLTLELTSISVNGRNVGIKTNRVQPGSPPRTARQARYGHTAGTLTVPPGTKCNSSLQRRSVSNVSARWVYPVLLGVQTIGVVLLYAHIVPLFKQLVGDPTTHETRIETRIWLISTIVLIQAGYWLRYRLRPAPPKFVNAFVGHLVVFAGRLAFTLATAVFSFVFLLQKLASQLPLVGYGLTLAGIFSLFCYMQELQRLGETMMGRGENVNRAAR